MGALVVISVVLILFIAVVGDLTSKAIKSRNLFMPKEIKTLQNRITKLEEEAREREINMGKIQEQINFTSRLLEDKVHQ